MDQLPADVRAEVERREAARKERLGRLLCEVHVRVYEHNADGAEMFVSSRMTRRWAWIAIAARSLLLSHEPARCLPIGGSRDTLAGRRGLFVPKPSLCLAHQPRQVV
jgi:hypothetical protein